MQQNNIPKLPYLENCEMIEVKDSKAYVIVEPSQPYNMKIDIQNEEILESIESEIMRGSRNKAKRPDKYDSSSDTNIPDVKNIPNFDTLKKDVSVENPLVEKVENNDIIIEINEPKDQIDEE